MLAELTAACETLAVAVRGVDPMLLSGLECADVVELLARTEKRCAGLRVLAAARAAGCGAHKGRGYSSAQRWVADVAGVSAGEAKAGLDTANGLDGCPDTKKALLDGELSLTQAAEIVKTEAAVAGSESELLDLARSSGVGRLKEEARRTRLEAQDPDERHRRQRASRYLRHWVDEHGMIHLTAAFTPDVGVALGNRIDAETDRLLRAARRDGDVEAREAVAADALAKLVTGAATPKAQTAEVILVCDISAFQRGYTEAGERCHVIGGAPVPVKVAQEMATMAFIKAVLHDGVRIDTVAHFGRYLKAELRTALGLGPPPLFTGKMCADCDRRYGLQWDHVDPVAHHGPTSYDNIEPRCWPCHRDKTRRDRQAGLLTPKPPRDDQAA